MISRSEEEAVWAPSSTVGSASFDCLHLLCVLQGRALPTFRQVPACLPAFPMARVPSWPLPVVSAPHVPCSCPLAGHVEAITHLRNTASVSAGFPSLLKCSARSPFPVTQVPCHWTRLVVWFLCVVPPPLQSQNSLL